jgi:hypothetical protein
MDSRLAGGLHVQAAVRVHRQDRVSLLVLGPALWARYYERMAVHWRSAYIICGIVAKYFNFVVLIIQSLATAPPS